MTYFQLCSVEMAKLSLVLQEQVVGVPCTLGVGNWCTLVLRQWVVGVLINYYVPGRGIARVAYIPSKDNGKTPHPEAELSASAGLVLCV